MSIRKSSACSSSVARISSIIRRIVVAQVPDDLSIGLDGDALGDQVLLDHLEQLLGGRVLGVAAGQQALGVEVGVPAELDDPLGDEIGMALLLVRVLEKLLRHGLSVDAGRRVVVAALAQHADNLRRQRLVEEAEHRLPVCPVALGDGTGLDVLTRASADLHDVREERLAVVRGVLAVFHGVPTPLWVQSPGYQEGGGKRCARLAKVRSPREKCRKLGGGLKESQSGGAG